MPKKFMLILYKATFAGLVLVAIAFQLVHSAAASGFSAANFFSFFTIQSNIFAAVMFLVSACLLWQGKQSGELGYLRGAATLYMLVTGIIYILLLSGDQQTLLPWVNMVLHYLFPVVVLADWLIDPPAQALSIQKAMLWTIYPLAYLAYSLVRGPFAQWYPYPFVDVTQHGYGGVALNAAVIAAGVVVLIVIVAELPRLSRMLRAA